MDEARTKTSVFIATSLDGFIAREDGSIEWLEAGGDGSQDPSEDYGYANRARWSSSPLTNRMVSRR